MNINTQTCLRVGAEQAEEAKRNVEPEPSLNPEGLTEDRREVASPLFDGEVGTPRAAKDQVSTEQSEVKAELQNF